MERLTQWYDDGKIRGVLVKDGYEENSLQTIITKIDECYAAVALLKEYEDTGLTPQEITGKMEALRIYKEQGLTPDQIAELKERDTAKAPIDADEDYGFFTCPSCGEAIYASDNFESHKFCLNCGQRIQWRE